VIDLGSQKGTFVNGQKVQKQQLRSGDELKIGDVKLVLTIGQPVQEQVVQVEAPKPVEAPRYVAPRYVMPSIDLSQVENQGSLSAEVQLVFQGAPLQVINVNPVRNVFVGDEVGCEFFVPAGVLGSTKMPLIHAEEGSGTFSFCFTTEANGAVSFDGGAKISLADLITSGEARKLASFENVYALRLTRAANCEIELSNGSSLKVRAVASAKKLSTASKRDLPIIGYTAGSASMIGMMLALVFNISPDAKSLDLSQFDSENQVVKFQVKPPEEKKEEEPPAWLTRDQSAAPKGEVGKAHKGPEGKMGKEKPKTKDGQFQMKGDATTPQMARDRAEQLANTVGVIGLIKGGGTSGGAFASVFGKDTAIGSDPEDLLGNLLGERPGEGEGNYGLGLKGAGMGGFGDGEGTMGIGNDGIVGKGNNGKCDAGSKCDPFGKGGVNFGSHTAGPVVEPTGTPDIVGSLDKDTIRRVIRRAMPGIKFCYEQALTQSPDLGGKVKIYFVVSPTGSVTASKAVDGIQSDVDSCVARKISQLAFPAPKGGGLVEVTYPFMFKSGGSN
jgi:hypothetical protein